MAQDIENTGNNPVFLEGDLEETSFFDVFRDIALPKKTGILKINSGKREYRFYFKDGCLVYGESSSERMDKKILSMIKNSGIIARDTIVISEKKKSKVLKTLLEILIEEGHVSMLLYSKIISAAVRINMINAIFETKGKYVFQIRQNVREVHGVRPVEIKGIQLMVSMSDEKRKALEKIVRSIYNDVLTNQGAPYLSLNKNFLQNFLVTEMDFIKYVMKAAEDYVEGGWTIQGRFGPSVIRHNLLIYAFRMVVLAGIASFMYLATSTTVFEPKKEHVSVKDFYFFKVSLISSLISMEKGKDVKKEDLLKSGIISEKELELAGFKNGGNDEN